MELRNAIESDVDELARIYTDSWNRGFGELIGYRANTPERLDRWRNDLRDATTEWVVAAIDGVVVGFSGIGPSRDPVDPALGELQTIAVDPSVWRRGIGRVLMADALDRLELTYDAAILWTVTGYARGHAFYRATGWTSLERFRADGSETAFGRRLHASS